MFTIRLITPLEERRIVERLLAALIEKKRTIQKSEQDTPRKKLIQNLRRIRNKPNTISHQELPQPRRYPG